MKFPLIHVYRAVQAIVSFEAHLSITYSHLFQVKLSCTEWILRQSAFLPRNQVNAPAKNHLPMDMEMAILKIIPCRQFKPTQPMLTERLLPTEEADFNLYTQ